jgi:hypothetical protein
MVNILRHDYLKTIEEVQSQLELIQPTYRWPLPSSELLHYECLYAVGGGTVRSSGGFPQPRLGHKSICRGVFDWYFAPSSGQYWADLQGVGKAAIEYYTTKETFKKNDPSLMLVFDIDETVLSNLKDLTAREYAQFADNKTQVHDSEEFAPALEAIQAVYLAAFNYGMSVSCSSWCHRVLSTLFSPRSIRCVFWVRITLVVVVYIRVGAVKHVCEYR